MAKVFGVVFLLFLWRSCDSAYFEDQPKFLTENGNFVIESAVNKNVTFRLKGNSCLNINDMNVMNIIKMGGLNQSSVPNSNLALRMSLIEEQLHQIPPDGDLSRPFKRNILRRLSSLEARVNSAGTEAGTNMTNFNRRIRLLETKVNRIMDRLNADNCSSNPCKNGGTCTNIFGGYICECPDAWTDVNCDDDVNECANFAGTGLGCQNAISCENTPGGYDCRCMAGWYGIHCTQRTVDCLASTSYNLCDHGVCVHTNDATGYRCICDQGWTNSDTSPACSIDVNECNSPTPHCSMDPDVPCINLPGTYACGQCPHGYTGNGHYCVDVDECSINNGGCSLSPFVKCINTRGSSNCASCPFGYTGDGRVCVRTSDPHPVYPPTSTDISPIQQSRCNNLNICHPLATCVQNRYAITCICPPHYTGNGIGRFGCISSNSTFDGCTINPCLNGGTCINVGTFTYRCECPTGTVAPRCSRDLSVCSPNPCQNGGTCFQINRSLYRCTCPSDRTGRNCQLEASSCGGILTSDNGTLKYPLFDTYPHNSRCAWLIRTDENKVLNVTFIKFNLEMSRECRFDWLQIHDGRTSASHIIGRFCGSKLPKGDGIIVSTQNTLYLWFRSDNSSSHDGFELTWNSIDPVCGGEISIQSHGIVQSPGSPGNYPPNRDCIWKLSAPPSNRIQLHFFTLQLEAHETCQYDYLAIYSGLSTDGDFQLMEKFCNTSHPPPLISPANELTLKFHSDDDGTDSGFQIHYSVIEGIPGCGGTFTAKSGEFGSPIQNGAYPRNIECHYLIKMPRKNETRVKLSFLSFKLEDRHSCNYDYVEIYDGPNVNAPKVGRWCGNQLPPEHSSLSNEILIVFHTGFSISDDGFRLKYETVCGGKYEEGNGVITSPFYPSPYEDNKNCVYDITAPLGKAIVLNFTNFEIEANCDFDSLSIYDGIDSSATLIGTYCGNKNPPVATSTMNHMHLVFSTDSSNSGAGFRATYTFIDTRCGGAITRPNMTISPSSSEDGYQNNANCKWFIIAPLGFLVQLRFNSFHLEPDSTCRFGYVQIFDNIITNETEAHSIGRYCGAQKPPVILSTSRALTIVFKTDDTIAGEGFVATYDFIDGRSLCGGNFYSLTGTITSPNYPRRYPPSKDCVYVINAPNGKQIQLNFESFDLEWSKGCFFDFLEIRNGASDKSPLIGTFCGTNILPRFKSFSNHMYLRFKSDSNTQNQGFVINYDTATSGCGGMFTNAVNGTISSPNYPEPYPANMQCDYRIQVARGSTINLTVTDLDLETILDCSFDYIAIYDGSSAASKLIGTYCHNEHVSTVESSSNSIFIRMVSDISNQGRGFEMKFSANCKHVIHDPRGAIESPNFPASYPSYANCEWKLIPPMGNRVFLEFSHFDLEHTWTSDKSSKCQFDHLTIEERDGNDTIIRTEKFCDAMPKPLNTSHIVVLKFVSDYSKSAGGFHLEYEIQGCGGLLIEPEGYFTSPNYPNNYPLDIHCNWMIQVDYGHLIEITFTDFDFETGQDRGCYQDGLIISNDANATKVINKFCGSMHNQKSVVTSSENTVYVRFYSDFSITGKGFLASYKSIPAKCGGVFVGAHGNITSLNYPNNYPGNTNCQWLLKTEESHTLSFQFTDFDLEDQNCTADYVSIYDGSEMKDEKLLLRTCGSQTFEADAMNQITRQAFNKPLKSSGNEMLIVMETDKSIEAKGFSAKFETSCGSKIYTSTNGILEIGHNLRWLVEDCEWTITANDPNQHVSLSIMHMDNWAAHFIESNETSISCLKKIYIYDGTSTSSPKIAEICSSKHPPTIISEGNSLTVAFFNVSENNLDFLFDIKAYYTVIDNECGGEFSSISGQIASPGYPKTYKNNIECEWTIKASPGNEIAISITMLDIADETEYCNGDYLEIREESSAGKLLGVYCGSDIPTQLPRVNTYWLKFRSDNDGVGRGFKLEYNYAKFVEQTGSSGVITSLLYPSYLYFTDSMYGWRVTVNQGSLIRITIDNCILKHENQFNIYNGYDKTSDILQTIETDAIPTETILSSTNVIFIEFAIPIFSETKFKLLWSEVPKIVADTSINVTNTLNCSKNSVITVGDGGIDNLKLQSPGFPSGYDRNVFCQWTFLPSKMGYHVAISFMSIDLEYTPNCLADFVHVESGSDMQQFEQGTRMCSMNQFTPSSRFHGTPNLRVQFQTDWSGNRTGFEGVVMLDCGGLMEGPQGEITGHLTISNRLHYPVSDTCNWTIRVPAGRTIQFDFEKLNLMKNEDGSCNSYIIIRNGIHDDSPFLGLGKYCGNSSPVLPMTSSNRAIVQFIRNRSLLRSNEFILKYRQVRYDCGGSFTLDYVNNSTIINSPNYPNIPSANIECVWRVTAPNGELLRIDFLEMFDLTATFTCSSEYLEVREGSTTTASIIGKYCKEKPSPIFSSSNVIRLKYFTDVSIPKNGFKAKVSFARCGKSIVANSGYVTSPGFPAKGAYPMQTTCDYHISGRAESVLNITFLSLDLPGALDCTEVDHIIIYSIIRDDGGNLSNAEVRKVCGNSIPDNILTFTSNVLIRFVSKSSNNLYGGFRFMFQSTDDICGGHIQASTGILQSPGYPHSSAPTYCQWMIEVPKGHRIKIEILDFDVRPPDSLKSSHRISFYNDIFYDTPITTVFPNNQTEQPTIIYSSDNSIVVGAAVRPSNFGHRGYKMRFTSDEPSICEGNLNENEGTFQTPENITRFYCQITRQSHRPLIESQPNNGTLAIKIFEESLYNNRSQCTPVTNGISLIFIDDVKYNFVSKCPPKYDNIALPKYDNVILVLQKSAFFKYRFQYKVHTCGGILTERMRKISTPILSSNYGELDCTWQYTTNTGRHIQVILNVSTMNCDTEYIEIYWGRTSLGSKFNRFCGDAASNQSITISGQSTSIKYHTESYDPSKTFNIEIVTASDGFCGGIFESTNYVFSYPKVGTKYPPNTECEWIIRAQNGYHVGLMFINRFMIETSANCTKDYVKVFNKINGEFKEIKRLCGREPPSFLNSTGHEMKLLFRSDGDGDGDGFTVQWAENCGGVFKASKRPESITSPGWPERYPNDAFCNYSIIADEGQSITIKFLSFDLESLDAFCNLDNVTIYKQLPYTFSGPMEQVGTYCLNNSVTTFRYTSRIDVVFQSNSFLGRSGFKFEYSTDKCGGNITAPTKIKSVTADDGETYLPFCLCVWFITAPSDKKIVIRFDQFDLEHMGSCESDYVQVFEGHRSIVENRKAHLCGNLTQHGLVINIESNEAIVKFASDGTVNEKGFTALILFTENCDQRINLTHEQPKYTLSKVTRENDEWLSCEYFVNAPKGHVIQAKFNRMHLMPCETIVGNNFCACNYLQIRDGSGPFSESFGSFCNWTSPPNILSTTSSLYMRFVAHNYRSYAQFSVDLEMIESPCGPSTYHLNDSLNSIQVQSPMMNRHQYKPNMNCIWQITAQSDKLIEIHFEQFDLEPDDQRKCTNDFLEINDDETKQYIREGLGQNVIYSGQLKSKDQDFYSGRQWPTAAHRYCGNNTPIDYLSQYRTIFVHFKSNENNEMSGFKFTAKIFSECARNYTHPQGRLFGRTLSDCESYISVPENYTITLYFATLDFRLISACTENNTPLKIYNGRNNELLESYCGEGVPKPLFTTTNLLKLQFKNTSHPYIPNDIYDITYLATDKGRGCGGELYNYGGTFSSPGYPNTDRNHSDCTWTINVPINLLVAIQFAVFDMGPRTTCELNHVEIIDNDDSVARTKFCGTDSPAPYKSRSSQLKVHFKSSTNFAGTGWIINFMAVHENSIVDKI